MPSSQPATIDSLPSPLEDFVACAHLMLDPSTPEAQRRALEPRLLMQLPILHALGVFQLFALNDPAMRAWLDDEWTQLTTRGC